MNSLLCSHPELTREARVAEIEMPWTPALDFGCNRHEPKGESVSKPKRLPPPPPPTEPIPTHRVDPLWLGILALVLVGALCQHWLLYW